MQVKLSQRNALRKLMSRSRQYIGWWELPYSTTEMMDLVHAGWCDVNRAGPGNTRNYYRITEDGIDAVNETRTESLSAYNAEASE